MAPLIRIGPRTRGKGQLHNSIYFTRSRASCFFSDRRAAA